MTRCTKCKKLFQNDSDDFATHPCVKQLVRCEGHRMVKSPTRARPHRYARTPCTELAITTRKDLQNKLGNFCAHCAETVDELRAEVNAERIS